MSKTKIIEAAQELVENAGMEVDRNITFPWLTNQLPRMGDSIPAPVIARLSEFHRSLGGNWLARLSKQEVSLTYSLLVGEDTLIEIDGLRRLSTARLHSLEYYDGMKHDLDVEFYRELCTEHRHAADRLQQSKSTPDFPFSDGRAAQAAYFDFAKDLLAAVHGLRLIRLPAPDGELTPSLALRLRVLL